jgi:hypothetical protein
MSREYIDLAKDTIKGKVISDHEDRLGYVEGEKHEVVDGAGITTDIAVSGLLTTSSLVAVMQYIAGVPTANLVGEASAPTDGNLQLSTTDTTGHKLVVIFR